MSEQNSNNQISISKTNKLLYDNGIKKLLLLIQLMKHMLNIKKTSGNGH